jgi:hypothetical protein
MESRRSMLAHAFVEFFGKIARWKKMRVDFDGTRWKEAELSARADKIMAA